MLIGLAGDSVITYRNSINLKRCQNIKTLEMAILAIKNTCAAQMLARQTTDVLGVT